MGRFWLAAMAAATAVRADPGSTTHTAITVWAAPQGSMFGGSGYGGSPTGAMITEQREVDVSTGGEIRLVGVAATTDAASVQLRSLTEPSAAVTEQRFVPGASTPEQILARHVGDVVTVVTPKGEVTGTLRAADSAVLVVEVGAGDQRRLELMHRDGFVQDVRLPAGSGDHPSLVLRLAAKKPGRHRVEITYRADGMSWTANYLAILDEAAKMLDFSAWATVTNATGASFDNAQLTLVSAGQPAGALHPPRFTVPAAVRIGNGESVQVELMKPRSGVKVRSVVAFEAMPDPSAAYQSSPAEDCSQNGNGGAPRAEVAVELDVPPGDPLPDGRVQLLRRAADRMDAVSDDQLRSSQGIARIRLSADSDISGDRRQVSCNFDERTRTLQEKIEVDVENKSKHAVQVVVREYMWRWTMWRIEPGNETVKGIRAGPQTQEYRVAVPSGGKKTVVYSVSYTW
jgi:hypothetical protein